MKTMQEYDLLNLREQMAQTMAALTDAQASYIAIYLSMVFAYTTVAFVAGAKLSRVQVGLVTAVYFLSSFYVVLIILGMTGGMIELNARMTDLFELRDEVHEALAFSLWLDMTVWPMAMLASLVFLWNVRREQS